MDMRGIIGQYLRGKNVYNGGSQAPNPTGHNQYTSAIKLYMKRMGLTNGRS